MTQKKWWLALAVGAVAAWIGAWVLVACLPDLGTSPPTPPPPPKVAYCGDGVIDYDGGDAGEECDPGEGGPPVGCTRGCLVDCVGGYRDPQTNHCYQLAGGATSYKDALDACQRINAHVVTYTSEEERRRVSDALLGPGDAGFYWVGIAQDPTALAYTAAVELEPGWAQGNPPPCDGCFAHVGPKDNQIPKKLDAGGGPFACVGDVRDAATWFQLPAELPKQLGRFSVVCEREPSGASHELCNGGTCVVVRPTAGQKRYLVPPLAASASSAEDFCRGLGPQGRLVVLASHEEREALLKEVARALDEQGNDAGAVWIGLSRGLAADGGPSGVPDASWVWDNGASVTDLPTVWGDKEPAASDASARAYAVLDPRSYDVELAHADTPSTMRPFVCEY